MWYSEYPPKPFLVHRAERRAEKALRRSLVRAQPRYVYTEEISGALTRFYFVGRCGSSRHQVRLFGWSYLAKTSVHISVDPSRVLLAVPEDYEEFQVSSWRGCYVKKNVDLRGTPLETQNAIP